MTAETKKITNKHVNSQQKFQCHFESKTQNSLNFQGKIALTQIHTFIC